MEPNNKLISCAYLAKYLPFINFLMRQKSGFEDKYQTIGKWIKDRKMFSEAYVKKIERSLEVSYRKCSQNKDFPDSLHALFMIDLCSDDGESDDVVVLPNINVNNAVFTVDSESSNDAEIVDVTEQILDRINLITIPAKPKSRGQSISPAFSVPTPPPPSMLLSTTTTIDEERTPKTPSEISVQENYKNALEKQKHKKRKKSKRKERKSIKLMKKLISSLNNKNLNDDAEDLDLSAMKRNLIENIESTINKRTASIINLQLMKNKSVSELLDVQRRLVAESGVSPSSNIINLLNKTVEAVIGETATENEAAPRFVQTTNENDNQAAPEAPVSNIATFRPIRNENVTHRSETRNYSNRPLPKTPTNPQTGDVYSMRCQPCQRSQSHAQTHCAGPLLQWQPHDYQHAFNSCNSHSREIEMAAASNAVPAAHILFSFQMDESRTRLQPAPMEQATRIPTGALQPMPIHTSVSEAQTAQVLDRAQMPLLNSRPIVNDNNSLKKSGYKPSLLQVKDPRVRKLLAQGQYGYNRTSVTSSQTYQHAKTATTKSLISYGEYRRLQQEKATSCEIEAKKSPEKPKNLNRSQPKLAPKIPVENIKRKEQLQTNFQQSRRENSKIQINNQKKHKSDNSLKINKASKTFVETPKKSFVDESTKALNRKLKQLECTMTGFNSPQDFVPASIKGKRRSSISARKVIAQQQGVHIRADTPCRRHSMSSASLMEQQQEATSVSPEAPNRVIAFKRCRVVLADICKESPPKKPKILTRARIDAKTSENKKSATNEKNKNQTVVNLKNTSIRMTQRNTKECVFCQRRWKDLTHHYVHEHKTESFVSRLTWEELEDWAQKVPFAEKAAKEKNQHMSIYKAECPFCPTEKAQLTDSFPNLRRHFSEHTGEYAFQCKRCGLQRAFSADIKKHQERTRCRDQGIKSLYKYHANQMVIYMYICQICNFVQLNAENVFKHLREQHGRLAREPHFVKEYTLSAIKDGPIERVPLNTLPHDIRDESLSQHILEESENICVTNEALLEESYAGAIKAENLQLWECSNQEPDTFLNDMESDFFDVKPDNLLLEDLIDEGIMAEQHVATPNITPNETKPVPEAILLDSARATLRKFIFNTGVLPELIYKCPIKRCSGFFSSFPLWYRHMQHGHHAMLAQCVHCNSKDKTNESNQLPLAAFEQHFKSHCSDLCLCFYCAASFADEQALKAHATAAHSEHAKMRIEHIPYDENYRFSVIIEETSLTDRAEFLMQLNQTFLLRMQNNGLMTDWSADLSTAWPAQCAEFWLENLSLPVYSPKCLHQTCLVPSCKQPCSTIDDFIDHLRTHSYAEVELNLCVVCGYTRHPNDHWWSFVAHSLLHSAHIFVCLLCGKFGGSRKIFSEHVCDEHNLRDVPLLLVQRSATAIDFSLEFIFAAGARTFTTTKSCFCGCGENNLGVDSYVPHLRRTHQLKLRYFCEYCNERIFELQTCVQHLHAGEQFKIRCQLAVNRNRMIKIVSVQPALRIRLSDENYEDETNVECCNVAKKNVVFKSEDVSDDDSDSDSDSDVIILENDEVVAAEEATKNLPFKPNANISCKKIL